MAETGNPNPNSLMTVHEPVFRSLPVPRPDLTAYRLNRWWALAVSPRGFTNYSRFLLADKRAPVVRYLPVRVDIEPVSRCNFHCVMCPVSNWPDHRRGPDMAVDDFVRLLDALPGLVEIKLQGLGEPLLGGSAYLEMIRHARARHIWVRTTVNGSMLHVNDNYRRLIHSGVSEVQISFDGTVKETFEQIRRGARFERVVENCKLVNSYCNERGILTTRMWVLLQDRNVGEFLDFVRLGHELGFKRMTFSLDLYTWNGTVSAVSATTSVTPQMARKAMELGRDLGIEVTFWQLTSRYRTGDTKTVCPWPFERAFISSDLRIVPCCMVSDPGLVDLGDARDFARAWNGDLYRKFRMAHLTGRLPNVCEQCYESE
jgi:pyrroloquinoline quinone biosynthesis protein E